MSKSKKIMLFLVMVLFFIITSNTKVNAASASLSASSTNVNVGDTVTITITINGAAWNVHVTGAVTADYAGNTADAENTTKTEKKTFKPSKAGTYKVSLSGDVTGSEDTSAKKVSGNITIIANEKSNDSSNNSGKNDSTSVGAKSNNANLKNLGIKPNDFSGFNPNKTSYDVTVPNNIEKVTVYATAQDKKAKIKGNTAQKLNVGKNSLNVVVTAEDGTQKTYTINVTREETANSENTNDTSSENTTEGQTPLEVSTINSDLKNLSIKGFSLSPTFTPDVYEYKVNVNGDVSSLDIQTEGENHNVSIDIVGNEDLTDGENIITILVYNEETKQNSTYQIIVNKTSADVEGLNKTLDEAVKKANKIRLIILGVCIFIVVCIIVFIIVKCKNKNNNKQNERYEYDDEDKDRLNLDEEDEFFSRINKENDFEPNINTKQNEDDIFKPVNNFVQDEFNNEKNDDKKDFSEFESESYKATKTKKKGKHF